MSLSDLAVRYTWSYERRMLGEAGARGDVWIGMVVRDEPKPIQVVVSPFEAPLMKEKPVWKMLTSFDRDEFRKAEKAMREAVRDCLEWP